MKSVARILAIGALAGALLLGAAITVRAQDQRLPDTAHGANFGAEFNAGLAKR